MHATDIIADLARQQRVEGIIARIVKGDDDRHQDLAQMVLLALLLRPAELIEDLHRRGRLDDYIARIVINSTSKGGEYYETFTRYERTTAIRIKD